MGQPTEQQEMFFDMTMDNLETIAKCAEAAQIALGEGDFDAAIYHMELGCGVAFRGNKTTVWEQLTIDVRKLREISDKLEQEEV